ncbi:MAG: aminotransferase class I/II-fold pyridoxal phosphate-dependent enzyme, partial [Candidatus Omnitrophica bacterium]|nr:aminotransferase class I/II-fold pyridoxal phosphate-dependent enzyme [Candidatus Omnitrophota bacterium]
MNEANRLKRLPLYLFTTIDNLKQEAVEKGVDVIDLGMGNPDLPTSKHIVEELTKQARVDCNQRYSRPHGEVEKKLKKAITDWYKGRFNVDLDPESEVLPLIGSKEGIANLYLTFLNHDDVVLVPNPAYPVHFNGVIMAGGILYNLPLTEENDFKPELKGLSKDIIKMSKILCLGYPHNPTTATVDIDFFKYVVGWAKNKDIIVVNDLAYSDIVYDDYKAPSLLEVKGAKKMGIEFHTLSKSYNMAGWRLGFVVGNKDILKSLAKTKSYMDFGIFRAVQYAGIKALTGPQDCVKKTVEIYKRRMDLFVDGLNKIGWPVKKPKATFYIWAHIPMKYSALTSMEFVTL